MRLSPPIAVLLERLRVCLQYMYMYMHSTCEHMMRATRVTNGVCVLIQVLKEGLGSMIYLVGKSNLGTVCLVCLAAVVHYLGQQCRIKYTQLLSLVGLSTKLNLGSHYTTLRSLRQCRLSNRWIWVHCVKVHEHDVTVG